MLRRNGDIADEQGPTADAIAPHGLLDRLRVIRIYMSDAFEWDETKAAENDARHGVSFEFAAKVFKDPFAVERLDDREDYGEDRFILIGAAGGVVLVVVYTERAERIRIISARHATKHEQDDYFVEDH